VIGLVPAEDLKPADLVVSCTLPDSPSQLIILHPHVVVDGRPGSPYSALHRGCIEQGVNKDSYLILDTLPAEYDSRVKAMEVDEKPEEVYTDIGGLDKQIEELVEAIVLPFKHKERFTAIGIRPPKGCLMCVPCVTFLATEVACLGLRVALTLRGWKEAATLSPLLAPRLAHTHT
jgi:hypothetical protein